MDWYKKLFTNQVILSAFANTLIVALVSSVAATVIGTAAAIGINSMNTVSYTHLDVYKRQGMRTQGEVNWWEACMLQLLEQDDF